MTAVRLVSRFSTRARPRETPEFSSTAKIADFLRDLVGHDGQRRDDAEMGVGQECRGDQHAVEHVVQGVADQHQRATRLLARWS